MSSLSTSPARERVTAGPAPARRPVVPRTVDPGLGLEFCLFLLVNAALFLRPSDVVPAFIGVEIYQYAILTCLAISFPAVLASLAPDHLERRPIDACVLLLLACVALSLLPRSDSTELMESSFKFFKIVLYYLLFVSLVTTPRRLRIFISAMILFATSTAILSALDFHKVIYLPRPFRPEGVADQTDPNRMYGPGVFQGPNDVCVLLVTCLLLVLGRLDNPRGGVGRFLWLLPASTFVYGFYLTQSRGGLLALLAGAAVYLRLRLGWARAILVGLLCFPALVAMLGARQATLSVNTKTGQERMYMWNDGLVMLRDNPLFGVGWNHFSEFASHVAHNSYIQAFSELGYFGGMISSGATFLAVWGLYRLVRPARGPLGQPIPCQILDPTLRHLYPSVTAAVAAYAMGMMTLSLNHLITTYTMLAMSCMFTQMAVTEPARPPLRFDLFLPVRFAGLGVLFLAGIFLFTRIFMS